MTTRALQRNYKVSGAFTAGAVLLLVLMPIGLRHFALAQEVAQAPIETMEEIIVYGDKSLHTLRQEVFRAEENFFAVFNTLNEDDEYDIRCFYEVPSFTHIRRHVCRAYFVSDATSAAAETWRTEGPRRPIVPAAAVIQTKKKRLREIMETLVAERPELLQALSEYTDAKQILESEKKRR